jgi:lipopolysaccharide transport system ATP-binding protein
MCSDIVISVNKLGKCYEVYNKPIDRLKQLFLSFLSKLTGLDTPKCYREFWALKHISFEIKKGETVGILGRNGSGKSTLLQLICGTLDVSGGHIKVVGRVAALLELGAGFNPEFTGRENVYLNGTILGLTKLQITQRFNDIEEFADIGGFIDQPVKNYSSGMMIRLAFAVVAHVDADILIIDEALAVGDAFFVQKCMRFLRRFMENGTVLFVSHDPAAVLNLCDRAIWLEGGAMVAHGEPKDITERYLEKLYEAQQGESVKTDEAQSTESVEDMKSIKDMRIDFINRSKLRNDIELFKFSPDLASFGKGYVKIMKVELLDNLGNICSWVVGGERVKLFISCLAKKQIHSPIIGFQVKDKLGQVIFGDNTYLTFCENPKNIVSGSHFCGCFDFIMPLLPVGDYSIASAVAEGTQKDHVQHHWIHDALVFKVHHTSVSHGLIGIPMLNIEIKV